MVKKKINKKTRVLAYCDSPTSATGFSTVSRNIFESLYRTGRYDVDIFGINFWGDPFDHTHMPYRIWPAGTNQERDPYGRKKFFNMAQQMEFDILFLLQDTFILSFMPQLIEQLKLKGRKFKSICYYPIDGQPKPEWINSVNAADYLVAYTEWGKKMSEKVFPSVQDIRVIPHGVNITDYKVEKDDAVLNFRKAYLGKHADKFVITNLNRNQQRKDIPRTIAAFAEFRKQVPDSILYLHMAYKDQGWNLHEVVKNYGMNTTEDVIFPENFNVNQGYPREVVNMIYNMSDLIVSTSVGEGWGLSWIEAMATKTPVLMPGNTAMVENITEDRGYLIDSGSTSSEFIIMPKDNDVWRPLCNVDDMVEKMIHIYNNYPEAIEKAENAYKWVRSELNWQGKVARKWVSLFDEALMSSRQPHTNESDIPGEDIEKLIKGESL
jgi:glycosyltransferase involved in cell wall biosynthesis